jgi:hypothetical protein
MVKLVKQFRHSCLKKGQNPEIWNTEMEDFHIRFYDMGSKIQQNQLMIHALNHLPRDHNFQFAQ